MNQHVAKDISYASSAKTILGKALIRSIENVTGRIGLIKRAKDYEYEVAAGRNFWEVIVEKYSLELDLIAGDLNNIPSVGPVIVVSNHPYGILDGLMLGYILAKKRGDFRIIANNVFKKAKDIDEVILPISFDDTREAATKNIKTRNEAITYLSKGGCVGIFPGGTVSTALRPFGRAMDPSWKNFPARLVSKSGASVVPLYFEGSNSRLFQIARHFNYNVSMGLMIREFRRRVDDKVSVAIGKPIPTTEINQYLNNSPKLMNLLRQKTYELSPNKDIHSFDTGYDFDG
jgi:putative hemolysin